LKEKTVKFYDSMGSDKPEILKVLLGYIEQEHMDKKKAPFDTSDFELENVKDIPRQMNGSDCGMFTLKYSEYLSRNASITFTQEDMPYYRQRMVYEIVNNKIIHP
jgi:sentrin-specific protease 1